MRGSGLASLLLASVLQLEGMKRGGEGMGIVTCLFSSASSAQAASLNSIPLTTKAEVHKYWAGRLHGSYDDAALQKTRDVPADFYQGGTMLMPSSCGTKSGRLDDVSCRAGCRARESLGHVLQACHRRHRGRVKRHDSIALYVAMRLNQLKWSVLWEPNYNVQGKVMKPDLVINTGMELAFLHEQKAAKYTVPDLLQQVQGNQQEPPQVTTATMNFGAFGPRT
ncbi:hypothetical protein HPB47_023289, partial [Ixodes persulcatus]